MGDHTNSVFSEKAQKNFIGYEYKEIEGDGSMVSLLLDGYENFGWEVNESLPESSVGKMPRGRRKTVIRLKRDRKIINKTELTRLQRNFEACIAEIQALEKSRTSAAAAYALVLGVIGTAFMAGATFAATAQPPYIILCIILAVPGFLGWIFPYFLYKKIKRKQAGKITPLIEAKYDEIYELCEKGNRLLY